VLDRYYRMVLDESPDGVLVERGARIEYLNLSYARFLGYRSALDLDGATIRDIAYAADQDRLNFYGKCRELRQPAPLRYEFRARRRDSSIIRFDASVAISRTGPEVFITTMVRPVSGDCDPVTELEGLKTLSSRESEILDLLLGGQRAKQIALQLDISEKTVATHRSRIYRKLAVRNDLELFRLAAERGLL
jgi:PAS domain S-box-containing protein